MTTPPIVRPHFTTLDGVRGLAAILIVIYHAHLYFGFRPFPLSYLAVDIFFLLSGAVVANAYQERLLSGMSLYKFASIRAIRFYPLYILGTFIGAATLIWSGENTESGIFITSMAALLLVPTITSQTLFAFNAPAWTLALELWGNIFYAAIVKKTNKVLITIIFISAIGLIAGIIVNPDHDLNKGVIRHLFWIGCFRFGYSFFLGVLLYKFLLSNHHYKSIKVTSTGSIIVSTMLTGLLLISPNKEVTPYYVILTVLFAFPVLIYLAMIYQPDGKALLIMKYLGILSYPIYALHFPILELGKFLSQHFLSKSIDSFAPIAGGTVLCLIVMMSSIAFYFYDEPIRNSLTIFLKKKV